MRSLAVILSALMHILIAYFLLTAALATFENDRQTLGVELVSILPEKSEAQRKQKISQNLLPKVHKNAKKRTSTHRKKVQVRKKIKTSKIESTELHKSNNKKLSSPSIKKAYQPRKWIAANNLSSIEKSPELESSTNPIVLRQGKSITIGNNTIVLKRGSEGRTMDSIAGYDFTEDDFRGHYETATGRQIVIIDSREEGGRLILHDKKTGLTRKLKKAGYGDFIYTYGPSLNEDDPVIGTIVFLPGDEHWIHRFMWMPDNESAEYPVKGRVDASVSGEGNATDLFVPAQEGKYPAVILARSGSYIPEDQFSEVARHLCGKGFVVLCVSDLSEKRLKLARIRLRSEPKVDRQHIGVWARAYRPELIPRIPEHAGWLDFAILTIDSPADGLHPERIASAIPDGIPMFIGFRNISVDWKVIIPVMLAGYKSAPHCMTILDETSPVAGEAGTDLKWLDSLSGDFVSSISAWLDSQ